MDTIDHSTVIALKDSIQYADGAVVSKTLTKNKSGNTTLFAFDKGQGLSEHTAPYNATVMILEGSCMVTIDGKPYQLAEGQMIVMPANVPHALESVISFKMLLIMIKD